MSSRLLALIHRPRSCRSQEVVKGDMDSAESMMSACTPPCTLTFRDMERYLA